MTMSAVEWGKAMHQSLLVLNTLHENGFPEAIVAGGFLRDLDNNVDFKDIDVFISSESGKTMDEVRYMFGLPQEGSEIEETPEYIALSHVNQLLELDRQGYPFQIIMVDDPVENFMKAQLDRFDIGLCKIAYDGKKVVRHPDYITDKKIKALTIYSTGGRMRQSIERANRIKERYPEFEIVYDVKEMDVEVTY